MLGMAMDPMLVVLIAWGVEGREPGPKLGDDGAEPPKTGVDTFEPPRGAGLDVPYMSSGLWIETLTRE